MGLGVCGYVYHASTVAVEDGWEGTGGGSGFVDVELDVVVVDAFDRELRHIDLRLLGVFGQVVRCAVVEAEDLFFRDSENGVQVVYRELGG